MRKRGRPFDEADVETLLASVDGLINIISNERVFNQLQKAKSEQSKLLSASEALSKNLAERDVVKAALDAAAEEEGYVSLEELEEEIISLNIV